jgi:hypothetical protein
MAMIPLKCPKCGASIEIDDQQENAVCTSCGTQFPCREAVQKYIFELAGQMTRGAKPGSDNIVYTTTTTTVNGNDENVNEVFAKIFGTGFSDGLTVAHTVNNEPIPGYDLPPMIPQVIRALCAQGEKIQAIKVFRQYSKVDLSEAKEVIDRLDSTAASSDLSAQDLDHSYKKSSKSSDLYTPDLRPSKDSSVKKSGCYIATAVYGSYDAPEVRVLRTFREDVLAQSMAGRIFIQFYYAVSPPIARRLKNAKRINRAVRRLLDGIVQKIDIGGTNEVT